MTNMWKKFLKALRRDERGITGLETAIILIAFVVVAAVFAYTVLSAGIFSSQKGQEAVYSGLAEARATLELKGSVVGTADSVLQQLTGLVFNVDNPLEGEPIDLTPPNDADLDGVADAGSSNVVVISYHSQNVVMEDIAWTSQLMGWGDGDLLLESGEKFEIVVDLSGVGETIGTYHEFTIQVKPPRGSTLILNRVTPAYFDDVQILN